MDSGDHYEQRIDGAAKDRGIELGDLKYNRKHGCIESVEVHNSTRYDPSKVFTFLDEVDVILGHKRYPSPAGLPDTGERREFGTGAVRDASIGKGHFHSIPPVALRKLAKRFEDGAAKYSKNNYMLGIPLSVYSDSLHRHFIQWMEGDASEDHAGAIIWNACCMTWTDEEIKAGRLPKELDDLPYRPKPTKD